MPNTEMTSEKLMAITLATQAFAAKASVEQRKGGLEGLKVPRDQTPLDIQRTAYALLHRALSNPEIANALLSSLKN